MLLEVSLQPASKCFDGFGRKSPPLLWWQVFATARVKTRHELAGDGWQYQHKVSKVFGGWFHSTKDHETGDFSSQKDWRKKFSLSHYYWESCFTSSSPSSCSCFSSPNSFRKNAFYALKSISCSSCKYFTFGKGSNLAMKPQHILDRRNGQWHFSVMSFELQFQRRT